MGRYKGLLVSDYSAESPISARRVKGSGSCKPAEMVDKIQRKVRITTRHHVLANEPPMGDFPMRQWTIDVHILGTDGKTEYDATVFDKVTYKLHETFRNPTRVLDKPPFAITEKGWGQFMMPIVFKIAHGGGEQTVNFDLNFGPEVHHEDVMLSFPVNKKELVAKLAESGPVPQQAAPQTATAAAPPPSLQQQASNGAEKRSKEDDGASKAKKPRVTIKGSVDLERLSSGLEQLGEQDVLSIVQMISDNKTPDIYVKNDVDAGEFSVDLFTVPNPLLKSMWDFVAKKVDV